MYGSHLSIAGGLQNALLAARDLHMDCVQVFTKNQRQWNAPPLTDEQIKTWHEHRQSTGINHIVTHDSYLINLASPNPETLAKSRALFRDELERCEALNIPSLVAHPGAHMKQGEDVGLQRIADSLDAIHHDLPGLTVRTCLEITAGQGTTLGYKFEHLARIIELVKQPERLAVCLDTAHLIAAGYDLTSADGCRDMLDQCEAIVGLDRIHVWHLNDSKTPLGSRVDRHHHIGHGHISLDAFAVIVKHKKFKNIPKILETAKEIAPDGRDWDTINIETLKNLEKSPARKK